MTENALEVLKVIYRMDRMTRRKGRYIEESEIRVKLTPGRISYDDMFTELRHGGYIELKDWILPRKFRLTALGRAEIKALIPA